MSNPVFTAKKQTEPLPIAIPRILPSLKLSTGSTEEGYITFKDKSGFKSISIDHRGENNWVVVEINGRFFDSRMEYPNAKETLRLETIKSMVEEL